MIRPRFAVPLPTIAAGLITAAFAAACTVFAWQPRLASFADDSVSYLVAAQVFSPWQAASGPVAEAFVREAYFPPLFPLFLGALGASHDIDFAHAVTALLLAACLPAQYMLGVRWLGTRWAAAITVAATALLPSLWINAKGILSEPLFILLLLATLHVMESDAGRRRVLALAILMAALVLTRTVGLAMVAAYAACVLFERRQALPERVLALVPAAVAAAAYGLWLWLRPSATVDEYLQIAAERSSSMLAGGDLLAAFGARLATQANAMAEAWVGALMLFWVEGRPVPVLLSGAAGIAALAGLALRLREARADGWMTAAYLGVFLLWPFPGQMTRFLFPLLPVLVLYAFYALNVAMRAARGSGFVASSALALTILSLAVPALGFIRERARHGAESGYAGITEWYRTPDIREARTRAEVHLDLLADMELIRARTAPGESVMWVAPSYIALLAQRRGVPAPPPGLGRREYREAVLRINPDYLFLSVYHPRQTTSDADWRTGLAALDGTDQVIHTRRQRGTGAVSSVLLRPEAAAARPTRTAAPRPD